jgi:hypothetical protein
MQTSPALKLAAVLGLLPLACGDDSSKEPLSGAVPDASASHASSDAGAPGSDGSVASAVAIPLGVWVDDLVDRHSSDTSDPDTVDDKKIIDDEDPLTFQKYFEKP